MCKLPFLNLKLNRFKCFAAASLERVPRDLYSLTYLLSNQPQHQHLLQSQTTSRPQPRIYLAQQKLRREEPRPSWTKRGIGDRNDKPPPWSTGQQAAKQLDRPAPFFLPAPQLTSSQSLDFPLRRPISGRRENPFQLPPLPPPTPSLRRALRWPPWPPDPHRCKKNLKKKNLSKTCKNLSKLVQKKLVQKSDIMDVNQRSAQMVPLPTNNRWGYAEGWHEKPAGTRLEQVLAGRALARMELRLARSYPSNSKSADFVER